MSLRARAANARYIARHPVQTYRTSPAAIGRSNRRGQAARERGRASRLSGVSAAVSSRAPFYRNRINRSTGRKNRDNGFMHKIRNEGLARMKETAPGRGRDLAREFGITRADTDPRWPERLREMQRATIERNDRIRAKFDRSPR
jgi:hypothetical protein